MEKNVPISKKLWNIVRFVMYMLHKGISKHKLLADFNATLKRGKNLIFNNRRRVSTTTATASQPRNEEYEFSCSDTPNYSFPFINIAAFKKKSHHISLFACGHAPPTLEDDISASKAVLELLNGVKDHDHGSDSPALTALSPYLPLVRGLRVTDSPFPLREDGDVTNGHVDKAADEFIKKFYKNLNLQKKMIEFSPKS
ncbi:unnamed protein product [Cochlearia groenlandica]